MDKNELTRDMLKIPYRRTSGNIKTTCPFCSSSRGHPNDKSLSVNLNTGMYKCHHCETSGILKDYIKPQFKPQKVYRKPTPKPIRKLSDRVVNYFAGRKISYRTLEKMKISEGEVFMPQDGKNMNTIQFNYYLEGELINVKYRTGNKHFMLEKDCELIPYNIDSISGKDECIITEGEMDALSFIECGYDNVVSVPNGANANLSYLDDFIDGWFDDKTIIYIASDTDSKGLLLRQELIRRFGAEKCKIVTYGEGCKDANEHLIRYGNASLIERLKEAKDIKVEGVFELEDYEFELDEIYRKGLQRGMTIDMPIFDNHVSFALGNFVVLTGIPGSGKSTFLDFLSVRLNIKYGIKVGMFSPEGYPISLHTAKIISNLVGSKFSKDNINVKDYNKAKEYVRDNFFQVMPEHPTTDCVLEKAKYLVRRKGIKAFIIDPFNRLEGDLGDTNVISMIIDKMINFCQTNNVLFFLMAHPRKMPTDNGIIKPPTPYDISGSQHFYNKADVIMCVHRFKDPERTMVRIEKMRNDHMGTTGETYFVFNTINRRYIEVADGFFSDYILDNKNYLTRAEQDIEQGEIPFAAFNYAEVTNSNFLTQIDDVPF